MKKATRQQTRDHNTRLVLKTLYDAEALSRADLARSTGLTRPTVSSLVAALMEDRLVVETGLGPSVGGKPPTMLAVRDDGRHLICVDLSGELFRGAVVDLQGTIHNRAELATDGAHGEAATTLVFALVERLLAQASAPVLGIGVGTPGLVDPRQGVVRRAVNLGWTDLPLADMLESRFEQPVHVANDSHVAALAEYTFGPSHPSRNLIVIRVGQGIGAGIVLNGQPFYGDGYGAGEIGHVVVQADGELCSCGNHGCLETTSSIRAMLRRANQDAATAQSPVSWERLVSLSLGDDEAVRNVVVDAGCHLGVGIANLVGGFNIQQIVLAGRVAALGDLLLDAARDEMGRRVLPAMAEATEISYSTLGSDIVLLGASALVLHKELGII